MRFRFAVILVGLQFFSCKFIFTEEKPFFVDELTDSTGYYFPVYQLADTIKNSKLVKDTILSDGSSKRISGYIIHYRNEAYSRYLRTMKSEILKGSEKEKIRFTWLRSFHKPVSISVYTEGDRIFLATVALKYPGNYRQQQIELMDTVALPPQVWEKLKKELKEMNFWEMPERSRNFGLDGSQWILEVSENKSYKFVERWSPDKGPFFNFCHELLKYARLDKEEIY